MEILYEEIRRVRVVIVSSELGVVKSFMLKSELQHAHLKLVCDCKGFMYQENRLDYICFIKTYCQKTNM